ncbi:MAG: hypothetical protein HQL74_13115 [Magnetococcales bacterium]|nr:hypothetical protein [Magnetococcales bacterium]MBF0423270.1 hypothetical protein [Magnetococcales bacterium]
MKRINITINGTTPLLCNRFTDQAQLTASSGSRASLLGNQGTPREIAESKLYIGHDGKPMIPAPNLFRAIIDGGRFFKAGKSLITTQKSSLIPACIAIEEIELPLENNEPWTVDIRAVRIPSTGGRILAYRPLFNDWSLQFTAAVDDNLIAERLFREIVDAAGSRIGLGDFRPSCKGPFGKFVVTQWAVEGSGQKEAA